MICDVSLVIYLFSEHRAIPTTESARVQRWALMLSGYNYYSIQGVARVMQKVSVDSTTNHSGRHTPTSRDDATHGTVKHLVTAEHIRSWTDRDPVLAKVRKFVLQDGLKL